MKPEDHVPELMVVEIRKYYSFVELCRLESSVMNRELALISLGLLAASILFGVDKNALTVKIN